MILAQSKDEGIVLDTMNSETEGTIGRPLISSENIRPSFTVESHLVIIICKLGDNVQLINRSKSLHVGIITAFSI